MKDLKKIEILCKERGMTMKYLAECIGKPLYQLRNSIRVNRAPRYDLEKIAKCLNVDIKVFYLVADVVNSEQIEIIKIEKGIPIPIKQTYVEQILRKTPIAQMEIGDSFLFPFEKEVLPNILFNRLNRAANIISSRTQTKDTFGKKYTAKTEENGIRMWRTN
jgi:transcriptional regulator with XRE-family HTH domain